MMNENNRCHSLYKLFNPQSIAIIGASYDSNKIGHKILKNIIDGGYKGKIYPINPKNGKLLGLNVYSSINEIKSFIDVAIICIPAALVLKAAEECGQAKVKFLIVISSGFSEIGNIDEENKLIKIIKQYKMRLLGPNVFGLHSSKSKLNATFSQSKIDSGNLAVISQSGALGIALIAKTKAEGIGLSHIISLGNKADLEIYDFLEYLKDDENTKAIFIYIEGVNQGQKLIQTIKEVTQKKPIIIIKAGRSIKGAMAASSHTGSLAIEDRVFDDLIHQAGAFRVETIHQALTSCRLLATAPLTKGKECLILTNGGGFGVIASDAAEKFGLKLYENKTCLKSNIQQLLPSFGCYTNPIDLSGQANNLSYIKLINTILKNSIADSLLCLACETANLSKNDFEIIVNKFSQIRSIPIVYCFLGEPVDKKLPIYDEIYSSVMALSFLHKYSIKKIDKQISKPIFNIDLINQLTSNCLSDKRNFFSPLENQAFSDNLGINTPISLLATSKKQALIAAKKIGFPLVMKVVSSEIIHKTDIGGTILNINNPQEVVNAYKKIINNCRQKVPNAKIEGILLCQMIQKGLDIIIGAKNDPVFGPIVMFGSGGIYVEIYNDVAFRSYPLSKKEILEMLKNTKAYSLLLGKRGQKIKDIESIVLTIAKIGEVARNCPEIKEIEINPLKVFDKGQGVSALDIRVILANNWTKKAE